MYAITGTGFRALGPGDALRDGETLAHEIPEHLAAVASWSVTPPPALPNTPGHYRAIRDAAWAWMTSVVQERRYDTIESCCSYANSTVPRYKAEALAMIAWRDAVNQRLEQLVASPPAGLETWEQVRALLPQPESFAWPAAVELPLDHSQSAGMED